MATRDLRDTMSVSGNKITRYEANLSLTSVINTTHLVTITPSRPYRKTPNIRYIGTESSYGIVLKSGVQTLTSAIIVLGFRTGSPSVTTDATVVIYCDVDGEF